MKINKIFANPGSISQYSYSSGSVDGSTAFITLENLGDVLMATAPATGINISHAVDYSITKALDSNFLVSSFGFAPVSIVINGLSAYSSWCGNSTASGDSTITGFFYKYNVADNYKYRIRAAIKRGSSKEEFYCVMLSLSLMASSDRTPGAEQYTLTLIGARIN